MPEFVEIARPASAAPGKGARVTIAEHCAVALFDLDGRIYAIDDLCVRCGTSLAAGTLRGTVVSCLGCDWRYDVRTGCVNGIAALRIDTFETKIVDARVLVATAASP